MLAILLALLPNNFKSTTQNTIKLNEVAIDNSTLLLKNYKVTALNNPFNIRKCNRNKWLGKDTTNFSQFESFKNPEYGIRAGLRLLRNYANKHNKTSIRKIVEKYAPAHENDTELYIKNLCKFTKFEEDQKLNLNDMNTLLTLSEGISLLEGNHISSENLKKVYLKYFK